MCVEQSGTSRPGAEVKDRISLVVVERGLGGHIAVDNTELGTGRAPLHAVEGNNSTNNNSR